MGGNQFSVNFCIRKSRVWFQYTYTLSGFVTYLINNRSDSSVLFTIIRMKLKYTKTVVYYCGSKNLTEKFAINYLYKKLYLTNSFSASNL